MEWQRAIEKNKMNKSIENITDFIHMVQEQDEEKYQQICKLKEQLEQNKTEKEKELEEQIKELKNQLSEWESSVQLYGFTPKERDIAYKWHKKHFDFYNTLPADGIIAKCPSHGHITYSIDIHPEIIIKSVKCATCGAELVMYDGIDDMWEFYKEEKKRIKKSDLEEESE